MPSVAEAHHLTQQTVHAYGQPEGAADARGSTCAPVARLLPASPAAPSLARRYLRRWACPDHLTDPADVLLLASELVTNALLHGAPPIGVEMRCAGARTIVHVTDFGEPPILQRTPPPADALSGRGLRLLDALAIDWGVDTHASGKTFWFTL